MRRKSARSSTKSSPEKVKEEKTPKKTRRHSKRHKGTSSESASEDEVSISSTDNGSLTTEKELWTVTQTEPSNSDIGKIKICLARPSPGTPERTSKRLRNKSLTNLEDSPTTAEEKPTRRSRRRGGTSSPLKIEEQPPMQQEQPQDVEQVEEKKGKGKSKGKHKSKIVEQTAHVVDSNEMPSEISENVQVTAQSPQNVELTDTDAAIVDCDLNQFEDEQSVNKSADAEEQQQELVDNQDTNDNVIDVNSCVNANASNTDVVESNDVSNNNVANDNEALPAAANTSSQADVAGDKGEGDQVDAPCSITVGENDSEPTEVSFKLDDEDVSMREVTHFEINVSATDVQAEDNATEESNQPEGAKTELKDDEIKPVDDAVPEQLVPSSGEPTDETAKDEASANSQPNTQQKEDKVEFVELQSQQEVEVPAAVEQKVVDSLVPQENNEEPPKVEEKPEESQKLQEEAQADVEAVEPEVQDMEAKEEENHTTAEEIGSEIKKIPSPEPEMASETDRSPSPEVEKQAEEPTPKELPTVTQKEQESPTNEDTCKHVENGKSSETSEKLSRINSRTNRLWGESTNSSVLNFLQITSTKLVEMYPTLTLLDEKHVRLESAHREKPQRERVEKEKAQRRLSLERRVSAESKPEVDEVSTRTTETTNAIALNRKISIVEDEASSLRPPPSPAKNAKSSILFITNLVRPFTVKQLRGLLERTGKITEEGFWTDKIKSKCYVQYETEEEAEATRNALHGVLWPIGNGKKLIIDYSTQIDLENARNPPVTPLPVTVEPGKENQEPPTKKPHIDAEKALDKTEEVAATQWDEGKDARGRRSPSWDGRDAKRRFPDVKKSRSPSQEVKKKVKREEPVQQRAMDDLFRRTEATPSIYWQPLSPEEIAMKQQQRLERMEAHKRKMETNARPRRNSDRPRGRPPYRRRY